MTDHMMEQIIQGLVALVLVTAMCVLVILQELQHQPINVPGDLFAAITLVLGFYFGRRNANSLEATVRAVTPKVGP